MLYPSDGRRLARPQDRRHTPGENVMFSIRLTRDFVVTARPPQPGLVLTLAQAIGPSFLLPNVPYRFHQFYQRPSEGQEAEL